MTVLNRLRHLTVIYGKASEEGVETRCVSQVWGQFKGFPVPALASICVVCRPQRGMTCIGWTAATGAAAPKGAVVPRNIMKRDKDEPDAI